MTKEDFERYIKLIQDINAGCALLGQDDIKFINKCSELLSKK